LAGLEHKVKFQADDSGAGDPGGSRFRFLATALKYSLVRPGFNMQMSYAAVTVLGVTIVGFNLTQVHFKDTGNMVLVLLLILAVLMPLLVYLSETGRKYILDLLLTVFWALFYTYMLNLPVVVAARLGSHIALKDANLVQFDRAIGVPIPAIVAWAAHNWLGQFASGCYFWLFPLMRVAVLLPPLAARAKHAQKFLTANLVSFIVGLPLFALFPAVGPWYGYPTPARPDQLGSQATLFLLRHPGACQYHVPAGIVCFPSFHVVWAILCARALWTFRLLRIPVVILAALIVLSTVTTGEHYILDLIAGAIIAVLAIYAAEWLSEIQRKPSSPAELASE
jgi:membrane-associated phospholipid phosphatase